MRPEDVFLLLLLLSNRFSSILSNDATLAMANASPQLLLMLAEVASV